LEARKLEAITIEAEKIGPSALEVGGSLRLRFEGKEIEGSFECGFWSAEWGMKN